jgi:MinD-like ATPase involved in chromosome partitioning or flagellar assembly
MEGHLASRAAYKSGEDYHPAGRLVPVFAASDIDGQSELALKLGRHAASFGETVLMLDCNGGQMMKAAGIIYNKTIYDVLYDDADLQDVKYVTSNEHFTAAAAGEADLDLALGSLAALSLSYDWVFVVPPAGCTPAHVRLASASDVSLLAYDTASDNFMRAYWMIEAVRRRNPKFDPVILSMGERMDAVETALMLTDTVREHLGAPPPYAGHAQDGPIAERLIERMRDLAERSKVA